MKSDEVLAIIKESLLDYVIPIYVSGTMDIKDNDYITKISATIPKKDLIINGNNYPLWYLRVLKNGYETTNILCITDFDKISLEEQKLFMDIICRNCISSEKLPSNLRIIINANTKCPILPEIMEAVQYIEIQE
jgi:hypothetical protein